MSGTPLHVEAPAPVRAKAHEIDRTGEPVFELRAISHSYGRSKVIFDVNLSVWPGEVVALVGDNGAGKSTLIKMLMGMVRPDSGRAELLGEDAAGLLHLPRTRSRRHRHCLRPHRVPFVEAKRAIVDAARQAEAIFGERQLAAMVAARHRADLRHGLVALVDDHECIVGKIVERRWRRRARTR